MIEEVLGRELGRVRAPEELWDRVQRPSRKPAAAVRPGLMWVVVVAVLVLGVVWSLRGSSRREALALQAVEHPGNLEFRSADADLVRAWVKQQTGLDVPLMAGGVRLTGAHVIEGSVAAVEVAYRVGNERGGNEPGGRAAVLIVSRGAAGDDAAGHGVLREGQRAISWQKDGQVYTMACAQQEDFKAACLACHAGGIPPRT